MKKFFFKVAWKATKISVEFFALIILAYFFLVVMLSFPG